MDFSNTFDNIFHYSKWINLPFPVLIKSQKNIMIEEMQSQFSSWNVEEIIM